MKAYIGNAASPGIAIGPVYRYSPFAAQIEEHILDAAEIPGALAAYRAAKDRAGCELRAQMAGCGEREHEKQAILNAHLDILEDEALEEEILLAIQNRHLNVDQAIFNSFEGFLTLLSNVGDPLIRERTADLLDVRNRLLRCRAGKPPVSLSALPGPVILVARDLLPSDTATLDRKNVLGIVTELGGTTSHTAILARSYEIPAVLGMAGICSAVADGQPAILDAGTGELLLSPSETELQAYRVRRDAFLAQRARTQKFLSQEARTRDGIRVQVELNIGSGRAAELECAPFTDGIGLFRTEFLYMERPRLPSEEEQFEVYSALLKSVPGKPVVFRTLDVGGDKKLPCLPLPEEANPFLGKRALRLCFERTDIFTTQLRAALRASIHGNLWIMFPMVGSLEDFRRARAILNGTMEDLRNEGREVGGQTKVGAMVEIPSIALMADRLALEADFVSIGTNDLTQYLTAADRMNPAVSDYYQTYHPALFRVIEAVAQAFGARGKSAAVCGELGGDPLAVPALFGLGVNTFSMNSACVASVKEALSGLSMESCRTLARRVLEADTAGEVERLLHSGNQL